MSEMMLTLLLIITLVTMGRAGVAQKEAREAREKLDTALKRLDILRDEIRKISRSQGEAGPRETTAANVEPPMTAGIAQTTVITTAPRPAVRPEEASIQQEQAPEEAKKLPGEELPPSGSLRKPIPVFPEDIKAERIAAEKAAAKAPQGSPPKRQAPSWLTSQEAGPARLSIIGGALVLAGLSFTIHALGLPSWLMLASIFAFAGVLWWTAMKSPWPVSGALRGLSYAVAALGIGSTSQQLPEGIGPPAVMLALLGLSGALAWDGLRRREPLLGSLAVTGSAISSWMLADDLGMPMAILAACGPLIIAATVLKGLRDGRGGIEAQHPGSTEIGLSLGLWATASVPMGLGVTMLHHGLNPGTTAAEAFAWLCFSACGLAAVAAACGRDPAKEPQPAAATLLAASAAGLLPQALSAMSLGIGNSHAPSILNGHALAAAGAMAATLLLGMKLWKSSRGANGEPELELPGALASIATAAAASYAGALLLPQLGGNGQEAAVASIALALLSIGLAGRSTLWISGGTAGLLLATLSASSSHSTAGSAQTQMIPLLLPGLLAISGSLRVIFASGLQGAAAQAARLSHLALAVFGAIGMAAASRIAGPQAEIAVGMVAGLCGLLLIRDARKGQSGSSVTTGAALSAASALLLAMWSKPEIMVIQEEQGASTMQDGMHYLSWLIPLLGAAIAATGSKLLLDSRSTPSLGKHQQTIGSVMAGILGISLIAALSHTAGGSTAGFASSVGAGIGMTLMISASSGLRIKRTATEALLSLGGTITASMMLVQAGAVEQATIIASGAALLASWWSLLSAEQPLGKRSGTPSQERPIGAWWLATLSLVAIESLAATAVAGGHGSWGAAIASLSSLIAATIGVVATQRAWREKLPSLWTAGMGVIVATGIKAATIDSARYSNSAAAAGIAVLAAGIAVLIIAARSPRPR